MKRLLTIATCIAAIACMSGTAQAAFRNDVVRVDDTNANTAAGTSSQPTSNGQLNTSFGTNSLQYHTGSYNSAFGAATLYSDTPGSNNSAFGARALQYTSGNQNSAFGAFALTLDSSGVANTAFGADAARTTQWGAGNVAIGTSSLMTNAGGGGNVAVGLAALQNVTSNYNTAVGNRAGVGLTTGVNNVALGAEALDKAATGSSNIAIGSNAGLALQTGSNNVMIGNTGTSSEDGTIRVGTKGTQTRAFLAGVYGSPIAGPTMPVLVNADGQLGTTTSSNRRLKTDIAPADPRGVLGLQPVSYRYKSGGPRQYGLIAEDVARRLPLLASYDAHGAPDGVYYEQLSVLLLAQLQRQQHEIDALRRASR